jgi:hypothetical protein
MDQGCRGSPRTLREQMARQPPVPEEAADRSEVRAGRSGNIGGYFDCFWFGVHAGMPAQQRFRERSKLRSLSPTLTLAGVLVFRKNLRAGGRGNSDPLLRKREDDHEFCSRHD